MTTNPPTDTTQKINNMIIGEAKSKPNKLYWSGRHVHGIECLCKECTKPLPDTIVEKWERDYWIGYGNQLNNLSKDLGDDMLSFIHHSLQQAREERDREWRKMIETLRLQMLVSEDLGNAIFRDLSKKQNELTNSIFDALSDLLTKEEKL